MSRYSWFIIAALAARCGSGETGRSGDGAGGSGGLTAQVGGSGGSGGVAAPVGGSGGAAAPAGGSGGVAATAGGAGGATAAVGGAGGATTQPVVPGAGTGVPTVSPANLGPRNLALHRAAYQSSAANYDNTAHLATDGDFAASAGAIVTAQYDDSPPGEEKEKAFDGSTGSKYLTFHSAAWIQYAFAGGAAYAIDRYTVASAADQPARDPKAWTLAGSNDGSIWTTLDTRADVVFAARSSAQSFTCTSTTAFKMYRLSITANGGAPELQLSEIALFEGAAKRTDTVAPPTQWVSAASDPQWIYVDLGAKATIDKVTLHWGAGYAKAYTIEVSGDAAAWREVYSTTAGDGGQDDVPITATEARFVRVYGTSRATTGGYSLYEIEVNGTGGVAVMPAPLPPALADGTQPLTGGNWKLQRASHVSASGAAISQAGFDDGSWIVATVPGTVLRSYLEIGAIPDPNFGDQQLSISEAFFTADFWYRDSFVVPASHCGRRTWLNFDGINWKADVYFNGTSVGAITGAYVRSRIDVTVQAKCGEGNYLAVYVHKNDTPGAVTLQTRASAGGNGGVLGADNPTIHASIGWDWVPTIRGRNTGLYDDVSLSSTGAVSIRDPFVTTTLPLPKTAPADLTLKVDLENATADPVSGVLTGTIDPGNIQVTANVSLNGKERKTVSIDKTAAPALSIPSPDLWWPNGYGAQTLYTLALSFAVGAAVSDSTTTTFGIRQITYDTNNGVLTLLVNGKRVFVRGGNWGMSDSMMRLDREGYDTRVRLHKEQNFTMIRNWVGQTLSDDFYAACDTYGILVWDDFWLANPGDGPNPNDPAMFLANAKDKIRRVRNHPSVALYCGRNEGDPPAPLLTDLPAAVTALDGTRPYISSSWAGGVDGGGPYSVQDPAWYFKNARGPKIHSEIGLPNIPSAESMRAMMPAASLWPIGEMWGIHDFCDSAQGASGFVNYVNASYGTATGFEDFVLKAQMVNMENHKAIYEAYAAAKGNGGLLWMSMSAWPSTVWQTFDYYLEPTAGYFGLKKACEPLHILWDVSSDAVKVTNNSGQAQANLTAEAKVYDLDGTEKYAKTVSVSPAADSVTDCFTIAYPTGLSATHFVRLRLMNGANVLSDNFYWRGTTYKSYTALAAMPRVGVTGTATRQGGVINAKISSPGVAVMIRLKLLRATSGERVLPAYYSDNYFSLLAGESKDVTIELDGRYLAGESPKLAVEGWNVNLSEIPIQ